MVDHSFVENAPILGPEWPPDRPLKVAVIAGESSGDRQAALLIQQLRDLVAPVIVDAWGAGGKFMREAGITTVFDTDPWSSVTIAATARNVPRWLAARRALKRKIAHQRPDCLILVDAGAFNVPIGKWAKESKICPVFYYFPPGSWRRVPKKSQPPARSGLADASDMIVTPFPWSEVILTSGGVDAHFVGHPLLDSVDTSLDAEIFHQRFGLDPLRPLVALFPGSRRTELKFILPSMIGAAGEISRRIPGVQFALVLAPSIPRAVVENAIRHEQKLGGRAARLQLLLGHATDRIAQIASAKLGPSPQLATSEGLTMPAPGRDDHETTRDRPGGAPAPLVICEGVNYDVMKHSDLIITKSGTTTLEAAILHKPMIIVYRGSALMKLEWTLRKARLNAKYIGLPNILADEKLFPELIQEKATPEAISELAVETLLQPERILQLKSRLSDVMRATLGEPGGSKRAAELLCQLIRNRQA